MEEREMTTIRNKMKDYTHFSFMLLFLSAFMEIGSVIPFQGKTDRDQILLSLAALVFITTALLIHRTVLKLKAKLENEYM